MVSWIPRFYPGQVLKYKNKYDEIDYIIIIEIITQNYCYIIKHINRTHYSDKNRMEYVSFNVIDDYYVIDSNCKLLSLIDKVEYDK